MTTKTSKATPPSPLRATEQSRVGVSRRPPVTTAERLERIEAMGQRVQVCIQYMCSLGAANGTSAEAKDRAIADFYEQMVVVEQKLTHIQEELRLG